MLSSSDQTIIADYQTMTAAFNPVPFETFVESVSSPFEVLLGSKGIGLTVANTVS